MDRKKKNLIICPKCGKLGTLRRKEKGKNRLICYHYDKQRYQKNESPDTPCYLGTLDQELKNTIISSWIEKKNMASLENEKDLKRIGEVLDKFEISEGEYKDFDFEKEETRTLLNNVVQGIATMTNEFRKSNQFKSSHHGYTWDIHCPACKEKYMISASFVGVNQQSKIDLAVMNKDYKFIYESYRSKF